MLSKPDLFLLDRVAEPAARFLNRKFGWSNFTVARWLFSIGLALGFMATYTYTIALSEARSLTDFETSATGFYLLMVMHFGYILHGFLSAAKAERQYRDSLTNDKLPRNLRDGPYFEVRNRHFFLIMLPIMGYFVFSTLARHAPDSLPNLCWFLGVFVSLVGFYFLACTPMPPRKREQAVRRSALAPAHAR